MQKVTYNRLYSREWYSYHFPELYQIVPDNYLYAKAVQFVGNRKELTEEKLEELEELLMDSAKARAVLDAARSSMGMCSFPYKKLLISCREGTVQLVIELFECNTPL